MTVRPIALIACIALLPTLASSAQTKPTVAGVDIHNGFITGTAYRQLSSERQRAYAMGLVDGIFLAPLFGAPKAFRLEACLAKWTDEQVAAVLSKRLADHPEIWHLSAHHSFYDALMQHCTK